MKYYLAEACQNTFVLFDCLDAPRLEPDFLQKAHAILLQEDRDDAMILTDSRVQGDTLYMRMVVLGIDSAFGEFCGNGARACAAYLFEHYPAYHHFSLVTPWGHHPLAQKEAGLYSITLPFPSFRLNPKFITQLPTGFHFAEMIEPHLIMQAAISDEQLFDIGKTLNQEREHFPLGINVNAWHVMDDQTIFVKTYERGVQRLTKSCGTGSTSCAAFHKKRGTCTVVTPGGSLQFLLKEREIVMTGPACVSNMALEN